MLQKEKKDDPYYIKSGYLYNLTKFIEWPLNAFNFSVSPFIIGVFGDKTINIALINTLREKTIKSRDWKVEFYSLPQEVRHCHLLLITGINDEQLHNLLSSVNQKGMLTVGDAINGFCRIGGMVNLVGVSPNFGYEVNLSKLKYAHLVANPEFLELASIIE